MSFFDKPDTQPRPRRKIKRTPLAERKLPDYTRGEEIFNMVSHIVGGAIGIVAAVLCTIFAAVNGNVYGVISGAIFGATLIILYTMSSIYHGLSPRQAKAKKIFQIFDHCAIFLLIAGTYTPFALVGLRGVDPATGWWVFGIIWAAALFGIIINIIDIKRYAKISMIMYLVMGWCIVARVELLPQFLNPGAIALLIGGGLAYTIGAIFYGLGRKIRYTHCVWHIFILAGSILHFLCILFLM